MAYSLPSFVSHWSATLVKACYRRGSSASLLRWSVVEYWRFLDTREESCLTTTHGARLVPNVAWYAECSSLIPRFPQNGFLLQIICLTIAPAFFAAGIYLTLSRIVITFGASNSRIKPQSFPRIFIPCDIISLVLQAIGGGMASVASNNHKSPDTGDHIMVAGLAFQVFTLGVFILLCTDFAFTTMRNTREVGADEALDASHAKLRASMKFKGFLVALAIATICIFIRSIYRVIELSQGWEGELIKNQTYFIVLEGAMVIVAVLALNAFHPGWCFAEGYTGHVTSALKNRKPRDTESDQDEKPVKKWILRGRKWGNFPASPHWRTLNPLCHESSAYLTLQRDPSLPLYVYLLSLPSSLSPPPHLNFFSS